MVNAAPAIAGVKGLSSVPAKGMGRATAFAEVLRLAQTGMAARTEAKTKGAPLLAIAHLPAQLPPPALGPEGARPAAAAAPQGKRAEGLGGSGARILAEARLRGPVAGPSAAATGTGPAAQGAEPKAAPVPLAATGQIISAAEGAEPKTALLPLAATQPTDRMARAAAAVPAVLRTPTLRLPTPEMVSDRTAPSFGAAAPAPRELDSRPAAPSAAGGRAASRSAVEGKGLAVTVRAAVSASADHAPEAGVSARPQPQRARGGSGSSSPAPSAPGLPLAPGAAPHVPAPGAQAPGLMLDGRMEIAPQVAAIVQQHLPAAAAEGRSVLRVALNPESLGHITISLSSGPDGLSAVLRAEQPVALQLMQAAQPEIRRRLAELGLGEASVRIAGFESESARPVGRPHPHGRRR